VEALVQIPYGNAPHFAVPGRVRKQSRFKIEISRPLEGKSALADIALILDGIVRDSHGFIVYTI
jgi:hypothetical protein